MTTKLTQYYDETARSYDELHSTETNPEHTRAMELGWPLFGAVSSVVDVGSGTGRSLMWLHQRDRNLALFGIEPSKGMIDVAQKNLPAAIFQQGGGDHMPYEDGSVDVAIATGIMHHVDSPYRVINEMFRVARKGIMISDHNNYAFGNSLARRVRMGLKSCGLLGAATYVRQGFNKQGYSEGDGWWYPYSLFDNYAQIARRSDKVFIFPTCQPSGDMENLVFAQSHFAIATLKGPD